ncbi:hemolysin family protein [Gemmatimonadota bacterium]
MMGIPLLVALMLVGILGSAFFSGAEIALISCSRLRMRHMTREGNRAAMAVERILGDLRRMVTATLIGTNFFNVATAAAATGFFVTITPGHEAFISTLVVTPVILVFGEILPKTLFRQYADGICLKTAPILTLIRWLLHPLVWIADSLLTILLRLFGSRDPSRHPTVTRDEILRLMIEGEQKGVIRSDESRMIHRAFRFLGTRVEDIMVPLVEVSAVEEHTLLDEVLSRMAGHGFSRIPVYRDRIDNIVGSLFVFDLLGVTDEKTVGDIMHPAYYVPESKRLEQLILEMKESRTHLAIVVDEFGGATGLVTLEDALERIVGEIRDEFDKASVPVTAQSDEWFILDAGTSLAELRRTLGTTLPEGGYKTIGGFLTLTLGQIPAAGELHAIGDWEIEVLDATPRKVLKVRIRRSVDRGE